MTAINDNKPRLSGGAAAMRNLYYEDGWNARVLGEPFNAHKSKSWCNGWRTCDSLPEADRIFME